MKIEKWNEVEGASTPDSEMVAFLKAQWMLMRCFSFVMI